MFFLGAMGSEPHADRVVSGPRHDVKIADFGLSKCLKRVGEQGPGRDADLMGDDREASSPSLQ